MKEKTLFIIWSFFAMIFLSVSVIESIAMDFETLISFPYVQTGWFLRKLSLSSPIGNVFAVVIYIGVSIMPIVYYLIRSSKKKVRWEDFLLIAASIFMFIMIYLMINPGFIPKVGNMLSLKTMFGATFDSILLGYVVLKLIRKYGESEIEDILLVLQKILAFIGVAYIYSVFSCGLTEVINNIELLKVEITDSDVSLAFTNFFFVLRFIFESIPILFELYIIYFAIKLCRQLSLDRYSESVISTSSKIIKYCKYSVSMIMLSCITINVLQLIFAEQLLSADYNIDVPLISIVFVFIIMLAAKYFSEAKIQKEENDMFI